MTTQFNDIKIQAVITLDQGVKDGMENREAVERMTVVNAFIALNGAPYQHMAMGPSYDCATMLTAGFANAGMIEPVKIEDLGFYSRNFHLHRSDEIYLATIERWAARVSRGTYLPGDIVLFHFGRCISHSAVVLAYPVAIHAWAKGRKVQLDEIGQAHLNHGREAGIWSVWAKRGGW